MTATMYLPRFFVRQRLTMMVNRYEIHEADPAGSPGRLMAVAQQKRMAFKEQVTFYADEARTQPVFSFNPDPPTAIEESGGIAGGGDEAVRAAVGF